MDWDDESSIITYHPLIIEDEVSNFDFYLPELTSGTDHLIRMSYRTENGDLCYPEWTEVEAQTEPDVPTFIVDADSTSFTITWKAHSAVETVHVEVTEQNVAFPQTIEMMVDDNPIFIDGFLPFTQYSIRLKSAEGKDGHFQFTKFTEPEVMKTGSVRMISQHDYFGELDLNDNGIAEDPFVIGNIESSIMEKLVQTLPPEVSSR